MRGEGREEKGGVGRGERRRGEAFLVMWPRRLSALNPPLQVSKKTFSTFRRFRLLHFLIGKSFSNFCKVYTLSRYDF